MTFKRTKQENGREIIKRYGIVKGPLMKTIVNDNKINNETIGKKTEKLKGQLIKTSLY